MRSSVAIAIILAAASAVPSLSAHLHTSAHSPHPKSSAAPHPKNSVAPHPKNLSAAGSGSLDWQTIGKVASTAGSVASAVGDTILSVAKRQDPVLARALDSNPVLARAIEDSIDVYVRQYDEDGLFARAAPAQGSGAVNWKKVGSVAGTVGKTLLHFLREEHPEVYARALNEELLAREALIAQSRGAIEAGGQYRGHSRQDTSPLPARRASGDVPSRVGGRRLSARGMEIDELD